MMSVFVVMYVRIHPCRPDVKLFAGFFFGFFLPIHLTFSPRGCNMSFVKQALRKERHEHRASVRTRRGDSAGAGRGRGLRKRRVRPLLRERESGGAERLPLLLPAHRSSVESSESSQAGSSEFSNSPAGTNRCSPAQSSRKRGAGLAGSSGFGSGSLFGFWVGT